MIDYYIWSILFLASVTGMTIPQVLQENLYLVPTHSETNEVSIAVLPAARMKPHPVKLDQALGPDLQVKSAIVMDETSGQILFQKNEGAQLPIASITKLMTALVADEHITDWNEIHEMQYSETSLTGATFLAAPGDRFTKGDILKTAMVASANSAAKALSHSTDMSEEEFVQAMNDKAQFLNMTQTHFVEPTGLSANNVSSVRDLAVLMRVVAGRENILDALGLKTHSMKRRGTPPEPTEENPHPEAPEEGDTITVKTTDRLIKNDDPYVIAGKTGFTYEAGHCLVTLATNAEGHRIITVVLGGPDEDIRFEETQDIIQWTYEHYAWE